MFGSQALETAIGMALLFFVVSTAASTIVEIWSRVLGKRSQHLEQALAALLAGTDAMKGSVGQAALDTFKGTSVYDAARAGGGLSLFRRQLKDPSYLPAKAFADAVIELLIDPQGRLTKLDALPEGLRRRLVAIVREVGADVTAIRAYLERQFDDTMDRVAGAYKRWATLILGIVGFALAGAINISTFAVAQNLWKDAATRQAVADAATGVTANGADAAKATLDSVAATTDQLTALQLPVGWGAAHSSSLWITIAGWVVTGLLVTLGGPFWFDILTRLVSLRSSGNKPPTAAQDPLSSTAVLQARLDAQRSPVAGRMAPPPPQPPGPPPSPPAPPTGLPSSPPESPAPSGGPVTSGGGQAPAVTPSDALRLLEEQLAAALGIALPA